MQEADEVGGEDLVNEIKEDRKADERTKYPKLSEIEKWIVHILCVRNLKGFALELSHDLRATDRVKGKLYVTDRDNNWLIVAFDRLTPKQNLEFRAGLKTLTELNYLTETDDTYWEVKFSIFDLWENYVSGTKIEPPVWYREETNNAIIAPEA